MTIYSKRLCDGIATSGGFRLVFTAPAGVTTVVRVVDLYIDASGSTVAQLLLNSTQRLFSVPTPAALTSYHQDTRQVLNPGDTLEVYSDISNVEYAISGYELS